MCCPQQLALGASALVAADTVSVDLTQAARATHTHTAIDAISKKWWLWEKAAVDGVLQNSFISDACVLRQAELANWSQSESFGNLPSGRPSGGFLRNTVVDAASYCFGEKLVVV